MCNHLLTLNQFLSVKYKAIRRVYTASDVNKLVLTSQNRKQLHQKDTAHLLNGGKVLIKLGYFFSLCSASVMIVKLWLFLFLNALVGEF